MAKRTTNPKSNTEKLNFLFANLYTRLDELDDMDSELQRCQTDPLERVKKYKYEISNHNVTLAYIQYPIELVKSAYDKFTNIDKDSFVMNELQKEFKRQELEDGHRGSTANQEYINDLGAIYYSIIQELENYKQTLTEISGKLNKHSENLPSYFTSTERIHSNFNVRQLKAFVVIANKAGFFQAELTKSEINELLANHFVSNNSRNKHQVPRTFRDVTEESLSKGDIQPVIDLCKNIITEANNILH